MANRNNRTRRTRRNRNNRNHRGGGCVPGTVFASQAAAMKSGCMWTRNGEVFKVAEPLMKNNTNLSRRSRNRRSRNRRSRNRRTRNNRR
jgi:hypothetical protein